MRCYGRDGITEGDILDTASNECSDKEDDNVPVSPAESDYGPAYSYTSIPCGRAKVTEKEMIALMKFNLFKTEAMIRNLMTEGE